MDEKTGAAKQASIAENLLFGRALTDTPKLVPGLILAALVVVVSVLVADYVN
jgi:hypothetical protein